MAYTFKSILILTLLIGLLPRDISATEGVDIGSEESPNGAIKFEVVDGLILLKGILGGEVGDYILDTGAPRLTINRRVKNSEFVLSTVGRVHDGRSIVIDEFQYGSISKSDLDAWAMDLTFIERLIDRPIAGILGAELLHEYNILIDFEAQELRLMSADESNAPINPALYDISSLNFHSSFSHMPVVAVTVDGSVRQMAFDTGAAISVIDKRFVASGDREKQLLLDVKMKHVRIHQAPFLSVSLDEFVDEDDNHIEGIVSVSSLNPDKVLISYSSSRVHLFWAKQTSK